MKVSAAVLFGAGLLAMALSPASASAQQDAYAPPGQPAYRADSHPHAAYGAEDSYGRYGQRYAGHVGEPVYGTTPDYGDSRYGGGPGYADGRDGQRAQRDDGRRYADGRPYDGGRSYDQGPGGYQPGYRDDRRYAERRGDGEPRYGRDDRGGYDSGYAGGYDGGYQGGYQDGGYAEPVDRDYAYRRYDYDAPAYGYGYGRGYGETYHSRRYVDRYAGFVAPPPIDNSDLEQLRAYCGCGYYGDGY